MENEKLVIKQEQCILNEICIKENLLPNYTDEHINLLLLLPSILFSPRLRRW